MYTLYTILLQPLLISLAYVCVYVYIGTGSFYLSFHPRNVPIDHVLASAETHGLVPELVSYQWSIPQKGTKLEKLYKFTWLNNTVATTTDNSNDSESNREGK